MSHGIESIYRVYNVVVRQARKRHECDACDAVIEPGDHYASVHMVFGDGGGETVKRCGPCEKVHAHLRNRGMGETWPDERLNCGETYEEHWGTEPPAELAELYMSPTPGSVLTPEDSYYSSF